MFAWRALFSFVLAACRRRSARLALGLVAPHHRPALWSPAAPIHWPIIVANRALVERLLRPRRPGRRPPVLVVMVMIVLVVMIVVMVVAVSIAIAVAVAVVVAMTVVVMLVVVLVVVLVMVIMVMVVAVIVLAAQASWPTERGPSGRWPVASVARLARIAVLALQRNRWLTRRPAASAKVARLRPKWLGGLV